MSLKYDSFIDLAPGYESVVDLRADSDAEFWSRYIVTDDMVQAVKTISKSLKPDDKKNDTWHFWIKGSYGTGKTYSAIVLKHLLQDDYSVVENFLSKNKKFIDVKDKFLGIRKKGPYYVKFRSGECLQLNTSNKFLFQIEQSIRDVLKDNGFMYTGQNSLIDSVQKATRTFKSALSEQFEQDAFPEYWSTYESFDQFYELVDNGDVDACGQAQEVLQTMNVGLATDLDTFKAWVKDVFEGNPELAKTGIFIIWDEFTEYIRQNDLDIIQQLSLFSQEQPLFIMYVMHEYPGLFSEAVSANMGKADARFHKIDISISDDTTRRLISESIITKDGMSTNWADICDDLYSTISSNVHTFMSDPGEDFDATDLKKIFPIHPMTVELVTKVAGIAASGRSIFMFLKSNDDEGFRSYIRENGYDDWKWVTADYLWDYYFVNNYGGKKTLTKMAEDCLKHYNKVADKISDEKALRVFKAAMLLLATIGSGQSMKKSKGGKGIQATQKTLYDCFCGAIEKEALEEYLKFLSNDPINALVLASDLHNGYRVELPYASTGGELETEIANQKTQNSIGKLFDADKPFGSALKKQFAPEEKAVVKRLVLDTCWGTTQQITNKYYKLQETIAKTNHKFGLLVISGSSSDEINKAVTTAEKLLEGDDTKRIMICVMKYALDNENIERYYEFLAHASLSQKANKVVNANSYTSQADEIIATWVSTALGKDMAVIYDGKVNPIYTNKGVISLYEKKVFQYFPCAPESIIKKVTLYKSVSAQPAYYAVSRTTLQNKSAANEKQKNFNQQWQDVVDVLRDNEEDVWDCQDIDDVIAFSDTKIGRSMSKLCSFLNQQLTTGTVYLPDLWEGIQKELGYYDTGVCCYLLGFAFKYFEGKFTWHDGNNAHKLDDDTVPAMIVSMCSGKSAGMKISSESDVEKRFKTITQKAFKIKEEDAGDVFECRKKLKMNITKSGYPIWAIKYLDTNDYFGLKDPICEIIDKYVDFILELGNQNDVMEEIVGLFKQNVKGLTQVLSSVASDKQKLQNGLENYLLLKAPEAKGICEKYNFTTNALTTMLSRSLEEELWQWREEKVENATYKLLLDLKLVGIVNQAINGSAETVEKIRETLSNYLGYVKVPGCIYKELKDEWAESVAILYDISSNNWIGYDVTEKEKVLSQLEKNCKEAIENIDNPISVIKDYIQRKGLGTFSEAEYEAILSSLPKESFTQTETNFKTNIKKKIDDLGYIKKTKQLKALWETATGFDSIKQWTDHYLTPAIWVVPYLGVTFSTLRSVERNERIDITKIENAITDLQDTDISCMTDSSFIDKQFIIHIASSKFVEMLLPKAKELRKVIIDHYKNPNSWPTYITEIREIVENDILDTVKAEAKNKAAAMNEVDLRMIVDKVLESCPEACLMIIGE